MHWVPDFAEFVLGRFSHFYIVIAYSNSTFCGSWTPSFCEFTWKLSKFQQKKHTTKSNCMRTLLFFSSKCLLGDPQFTGLLDKFLNVLEFDEFSNNFLLKNDFSNLQPPV